MARQQDKFVSVMGDFVSVATFNFSDLEEKHRDMKSKVSLEDLVNSNFIKIKYVLEKKTYIIRKNKNKFSFKPFSKFHTGVQMAPRVGQGIILLL